MFSTIKKYKILILISLIYFTLRVINLGFDHTNNDSIRWHNRTDSFLEALKSGDFENTYQRYHPGVILMWVGAIPRQIFYVYQYNFLVEKVDIYSNLNFPITNFLSKISIICTIFIVLMFQVYYVNKLWGEKVSLIYFFLISVEPYFIGINRWFHLTSLEVVLSFASILSLLVFLSVKKKIYFVISAIFFAFSVLTKVTSLILVPIIFIILVNYYLKTKDFKVFIYYFLIYIFTIFISFPALWVNPYGVTLEIIGSIFNAVGQDIRVTQLSPFLNRFFYLVVLPFKLSEITLLLLCVFVFNLRNVLKKFKNLVIFLVFLVYIFFLSFSDQKIDRYSLVFFSPIILYISLNLARLKSGFLVVVISIYVSMVFINYFQFGSNVSAFYNRLLGGTSAAILTGVYENGGNYMSGAAFFMNKNFPNESVYVPNNYEAFSYFYSGKSERSITINTKYVVNTLDIDRITFNNYGCNEKIAEFGPLDYPVVSVFKCY